MRRRRTLLALTAVLLLGGSAAAVAPAPVRTLDGRRLSPAAIARTVQARMAAEHVTGLGVALIQNGRVRYAESFGQRDAAQHLPLANDTVMYSASLTKATFTWFVMQLVDAHKVDLDTPIEHYLPKPLPDYPGYAELKDDPRWRRLTLRILLNHTSGFANFRGLEPDQKLHFHRDPGTRYGYSGDGINLAQFVLEQGLGLDVPAEMQRRIFDRFGMKRTALTWRPDFAGNASIGYTEDGTAVPHQQRSRARAAGSMDTTLADWSAFLAAVARGDGLSAKARAEMVRPSIAIDSATEFPSLAEARTDRWRAIRLGYAVGWGTFETPYGHAFFKEGHDDGTSNYAVCVDRAQACILLLSNDNRAERIFAGLVDELLGPIHLPAEWEGYRPAS
jgi:CubicO group peptidase (beta-lactamase class C family)